MHRYNPALFGMNTARHSLELVQKYTEGMDFLNRWIYRLSESYLGESILEVGPGGGAWLRQLVKNRKFVRYLGLELNPVFVADLRKRFAGFPNVEFQQEDFLAEDLRPMGRPFDTVISICCLEHLADDKLAVGRMKEILLPGGKIILYLPGLPSIYNFGDHLAGHFRRYNKNRIRVIASQLDLRIARLRYHNLPGILSWVLQGLRRDTNFALNVIPSRWMQGAIRRYLKLESSLRLPLGLNLFCVLERPYGTVRE